MLSGEPPISLPVTCQRVILPAGKHRTLALKEMDAAEIKGQATDWYWYQRFEVAEWMVEHGILDGKGFVAATARKQKPVIVVFCSTGAAPATMPQLEQQFDHLDEDSFVMLAASCVTLGSSI